MSIPNLAGATFFDKYILLSTEPFDQGVSNTELAETLEGSSMSWMAPISTSLFSVAVNGIVVPVQYVYMHDGALLVLGSEIPSNADVVISYVDPSGDQAIGVLQNSDGEDAATATLSAQYLDPRVEYTFLEGAELGAKFGVDDYDWYYGNSSGFYVASNGDSGGQPDTPITVTTVTDDTFVVEVKPIKYFDNPSYDSNATSGFKSYKYSNELSTAEFLKNGRDIKVGDSFSLLDLLSPSANEKVNRGMLSVMVTNDSSVLEPEKIFKIREDVPKTPGQTFWLSLETWLYDYSGVNFNENLIGSNFNDAFLTKSGNDNIFSGAGNDSVTAGAGNDVIEGGDGADDLTGDAGTDTIDGGEGNDIISAGADADTVTAGTGDDSVSGGEGADGLTGGIGVDTLDGGAGNDSIEGGDGADDLTGGAGMDAIEGGTGDDTVSGGEGADDLTGGIGADTLDGGAGDDVLYSGDGNDNVAAGEGADLIIGGDGAGDDTYDGGTGADTVKYTSAVASITVNLAIGTATSTAGNDAAGIGTDKLTNIENVIAGNYADSLIGSTEANVITGIAGNDSIDGGLNTDTAVYLAARTNYTVTETDSGFTVINNTGTDGTDKLVSIERLQFSDQAIAYDADTSNSAGGIYRLYKAALDRDPDLGGLGYWIAQADAGTKDAVRMATDFTYADEFKTLYGVQTADNYMTGEDITALVTKIYENVLNRAPDAGGRDYYAGQITAKSKTVGQVLAEISDSAENKLAVADLIGTGIAYTPWVG